MAKPGIPAIERGTAPADEFAALCRLGWSDTKIAAQFDISWMTARKYRIELAPETLRRKKKPPADDTAQGAVSVGTDNREVTPEAEGIGATEGNE
jgi:hypothetical protein